MNCSPPGSSARGILQASILEWVAIPFSRGPSPARDRTRVSGGRDPISPTRSGSVEGRSANFLIMVLTVAFPQMSAVR